jgi:hypothetical protein
VSEDDSVQATAEPDLSQCDQLHSVPTAPEGSQAWFDALDIPEAMPVLREKTRRQRLADWLAEVDGHDKHPKEAEIIALRTRIAELETALAPFAAALDGILGEPDALDIQSIWDTDASQWIKVGNLRRARSVLASPQRQGDRPVDPHGERQREPS